MATSHGKKPLKGLHLILTNPTTEMAMFMPNDPLAEQQQARRVVLSVPHFLVAPFILAQTDLIATLAARVAAEFATSQKLKILPSPLPLKGFYISMRSHQSTRESPAHVWLRALLAEVAAAL
ncbi:MAG: hypothetical protein F6J97_24445 [Leptolyngbya sp. SIO4C1]|nr:hypothetical protein [Leptolyngbya sp. SIO4C1]